MKPIFEQQDISPVEVEGLLCDLLAVTMIPGESTVIVRVPDGECPDMTGCVNYAKGLLPTVRTVWTISGDEPLNLYFRVGKAWTAMRPPAGVLWPMESQI